jgi:anti-sigma factor RsiW
MMTCRDLTDLLLEIAAGELLPEQRDHVEEHLRVCPSCVAYVESYRLTIHLAQQLPRAPVPPQLMQRLRVLLAERA